MITQSDLSNFTGTDCWYRHAIARGITYTEGTKYVAETCGAFWLLDKIAISQITNPKLSGEDFQCWKLTVMPNHTGTLICDDGNGNILYHEQLQFTDFPMDKIDLWCVNNVILLPSEY